MWRSRAVATLVLLAGLLCCAGPGTPDLGEVLDRARLELEAPGAILGIRNPDGTVVAYASGVADLISRRPVDAADAFEIGSISKMLTSVVVFRLAEEDRLAIDDPLARFLPDFPRSREIHLRHLLQQTSGLKDFYLYLYYRPDREEMIEAVTRDWTQVELIELAARFGHHFDPGSDWDYSNTNYFLLGLVIEQASGMTLAEAYRHYVFDPLGMDTNWLSQYEPDRAETPLEGYSGYVEGWPHSEMFGELGPTAVLEHSKLEWGSGGVISTVEETLRFLHALVEGELLSSSSREQMLRTVPAQSLGQSGEQIGIPPDLSNEYGHGVIRTGRPGYEMLGHGGILAGHTAGLWHLPQCGVYVALYFNRGFVPQRLLLDRVVEALGTCAN
jgi:D-alanyl-D-alanine carboxypeptidase